ncbi:MAG: type III polyketide synthase [Planctomycetaceae bacterium]
MTFGIQGLGTATPPHVATQVHLAEMSTEVICQEDRQERLMSMLFKKSGIETRQSVLDPDFAYAWKADAADLAGRGPSTGERMRLYAKFAGPLATTASSRALADAVVNPSEITHLVTVSCTGFSSPGVDSELMTSLGLRSTVERVHVGYMGCHGAINGLRVARGLAASDPNARILLCAVELCSLHFRMDWDDEGIKGNALFSDGAAAVVCGNEHPEKSHLWTVSATGSWRIPNSGDEMSWTVGDYGFDMRLTSRVPPLIEQHLAPWLTEWLASLGQTIESIKGWVVHPGGPRILDAVETALSLPPNTCDISRTVLRELGNMSSPTILFVLDRMRTEHPSGPHLLLAFGPGLTTEAALLH